MKKLIAEHKKEFLHFLEEIRGYSDLTIKSYDETLRESAGFIEVYEENTVLFLNLMPYRIHISKQNAKTISRKLSTLRSFVEYLNTNAIVCTLKADESIKTAKTLPKPIAHKHILEALKKANEEERLIVTLLYSLGLRISELTSLEVANISDEWVRIMGKGKKQRDVPILKKTSILIREYLGKKDVKKFILEKKGVKLSENSLRYMITKVFKRVALKVTPHQLRHSFATELLNNSARISDVSELLGHSSMATTQIYTKLGTAFKQQSYKKAHPLCSLK